MIYYINEIFLSRQGEGFNQGKEVVFIRLAGCNLTCEWCDTNYHPYTEYTVDKILDEISNYNCPSALITGGEPSAQNLLPLLNALKEKNYWTAIETNGTLSLERYKGLIDYITVSPKKQIKQNEASELRIVNESRTPEEVLALEAEIQAAHHYISPLEVDGKMNVLESMVLVDQLNQQSKHRWSISIQLHKLAGIR